MSLRAGLCPLFASLLPSGLREGGANAWLSPGTSCASHSEQMRVLLQRGFAPVLPGTSRGLGGGRRTGEGGRVGRAFIQSCLQQPLLPSGIFLSAPLGDTEAKCSFLAVAPEDSPVIKAHQIEDFQGTEPRVQTC